MKSSLPALFAGVLLMAAPGATLPRCSGSGAATTLDEVVHRIETDTIKYVFVGEHHGVGPVKRFAVDLANALVDRGHDVGLYVEGFRTNCEPGDWACGRLAQLFNVEAFSMLLERSRVPVWPLDPPENDNRAARMASTIADGKEALRVVLTGNAHVVHAGNPTAEYRVFGGGLRFPDPGDVVEAFPHEESLTVILEPAGDMNEPYSLRQDGCSADYHLLTPFRKAY